MRSSHGGVGLLAGGNQLLGKVDDQRNSAPLFLLLGHAQKKPAEHGRQADKVPRRPLLVEVGVLDVVIDLEPLEKPPLHIARAKAQPVGDVEKEQAGALGKKPADQESLQAARS